MPKTSAPVREENVEIELLERTGSGDRTSFRQIYDRYSGVLFSTAFQVLNDAAEAEDVLQDVFVQIWDKAALYDRTRGKPLTWALTLTRNKAIDRLRSAQRRHRLKDEVEREAALFEHRGTAPGRDSVETVYASEQGTLVRNAVLQLSREQRQAIELAFFSGLTQHEIADRLREPLGTVKARIRRGMIRLKGIITPRL
ncbi:MAG: sigma-70 family RNA polymerase sigma factor [Verrucomicrobia bacterium]|nr:sigma-70 family RNA polymerase sigma factor [Verrucomicrobiota bacterium]